MATKSRFIALFLCFLPFFSSLGFAGGAIASKAPLFANNSERCIPRLISDLPAFPGQEPANGNCSVRIVIKGQANDVSKFYFDEFSRRGWSVANRISDEKEIRFTAQRKKFLTSITVTQRSAENTEVEFSY